MEAPLRYSIDELLAEAGWLSTLARRLVSDPSEADDVVQDTWMAVLRRPPERERPLRPWLASVARNVARMRRRSASSRALRETARASEREISTPDELAARFEGQRRLVDALARLAEPYRATILLAYFERRTSEEIGRQLGISAGTVRWRVKAGIDALRRDLDQRNGGDRSAWTALLVPLARGVERDLAPTSTAALPWQGALLVSTMAKVGAAAAAVVLVVSALVLSGVVPTPWAGPPEAAVVPVTFAPIAPSEVVAAPALDAGREPVSVRAEEPSEALAERTPAPAAVEARFLDRSGTPIGGGVLALSFSDERRVASTDAEGRVRLELSGPGSKRLRASAAGFAAQELTAVARAGEATQLGDLVLEPGGDIRGRVVDLHGDPVAGALVVPSEQDRPSREIEVRRWMATYASGPCFTFSDPAGEFVVRGVPEGFARLAAWKDGCLTTFTGAIEVRAGQESRGVEIVLEPYPAERSIAGVVVDPGGAPVPWAWVVHECGGTETANADEHGRFRFAALSNSPHAIGARDREGRHALAMLRDVAPGTTDIVLALGDPAPLQVTVRARDGDSLERFTARAFHPDLAARIGIVGVSESGAGPHAGGRASLSAPSSPYVVEVDAPGFALGRAGPFEGAEPREVEIILDPMPGVRGLVLADDRPVAGARVRAFALDGNRYERDGFRVRWNPEPAAKAESDANGEFVATLRERGSFVLRVEAKGFAPCELGPIEVDPLVGVSGLVAHLGQGGAIEGVVLVPLGRSPEGTIVAFSRGDGAAFTRRVGADGSFRAERLLPGRWLVKAVGEELDVGARQLTTWSGGEWDELPWSCEVESGATTRFDLDLSGGERVECEIAGALTVDGGAPGPWSVAIVTGAFGSPAGEKRERVGQLDLEGRFRHPMRAVGKSFVFLTALDGPLASTRIVAPIELVPGVNDWSLDLATARVRIEGVSSPAADGQEIAVVWVGPRGSFAVLPFTGETTADLTVPAGTLRLVRLADVPPAEPAERWPALAEVVAEPGATATLRAP